MFVLTVQGVIDLIVIGLGLLAVGVLTIFVCVDKLDSRKRNRKRK